jgi:outer membrane protein assembly factor BamA
VAIRLAGLLLIGAVCGTVPHAALGQPADPMEGRIVSEIRVSGLRRVSSDVVQRHLATKPGEPFRRATIAVDQRQLDELRLFTAVLIEPRLEIDGVVLEVAVTETLRLLPVFILRVTDENGLSAGPGVRGINFLGHRWQSGVAVRFGGETGVAAAVDATTITPGTWAQHVGFSYTSRENKLYDFDERSTSVDARVGHNWKHGVRTGATAEFQSIDTGSSGASLSADGTDLIATVGVFTTIDRLDSSTNPRHGTWAEVQADRLFADASSWTVILDGRRFQRLSDRHGLGLFSLVSMQTGDVGVGLPGYLQFDLGGANSVRGWRLGARRGRNQFIGTAEYTYVVQPVRAFTVKGVNLYAGLQVAASLTLARRRAATGYRNRSRRRRSMAMASGCGCSSHLSISSGSTWHGASPDRARRHTSASRSKPLASASGFVSYQRRDAADDML